MTKKPEGKKNEHIRSHIARVNSFEILWPCPFQHSSTDFQDKILRMSFQ